MTDVGVAEPYPVGEGQKELNALAAGGFSNEEIFAHKEAVTQQLLQGGFTPQEIDKHWGEPTLKSEALDKHLAAGLDTIHPDDRESVAKTLWKPGRPVGNAVSLA